MLIKTGSKYVLAALLITAACSRGTGAQIEGPGDDERSKENRPADGVDASFRADVPPQVWIGRILIRDKHEGPFSGDPEIYIKCRTNLGANYVLNLPDVDRVNRWYQIDRSIDDMRFHAGENSAVCKVRESDDGPDDYLATVKVNRADLSDTPKTYTGDDAVFTLYLH